MFRGLGAVGARACELSRIFGRQWHADRCSVPQRGIVAMRVAGFRSWLKLGRCVRKGERALRIFAPVTVKEHDEYGREAGGVTGVL